MNIILIPPADRELDDAIVFYNNQLYGLGDKFYNEFLNVCHFISIFPHSWSKIGYNTRKINIKNFPYLILYIVDGNDILVTCLSHQHRNPTYYIKRVE